ASASGSWTPPCRGIMPQTGVQENRGAEEKPKDDRRPGSAPAREMAPVAKDDHESPKAIMQRQRMMPVPDATHARNDSDTRRRSSESEGDHAKKGAGARRRSWESEGDHAKAKKDAGARRDPRQE